MMKALLIIDYTNDFVADDGSLTCGKPAQDIEERITEITKEFVESNDYVLFAVDVHEKDDPYHPETKLYPPHNLRNSKGRDQYGRLGSYYEQLQQSKNLQVDWVDKTRYSAFCGTDIEMRLRMRNITEVHLVGVCTDICVLHTAVDAYNKGFQIVVHEDAVQSFSQSGHEWALNHFTAALGAKVVRKNS
ncbi:cysteine hydrolase [Anaerobacillus alkaliphilus]|uniref:Cysteine hydrolase n=1 Tax=Anaerobacillus alkaliphilus TaxID=1548597 RepID=A0A4Q0VZI4_9BACI|nr:isochorismatase family cysteine hydrolase [Anaerobacillus alkaliphilus]RXJ04001.1 cysteine hydrolase [Anaerobacillus alkaliphilus]